MPVPAPASDQQIADALTRDGLHWNTNTITYSFNDFSTGGNSLNATVRGWVDTAIEMVEEILDLDFQLLASGGDITFNGSSGNGTYAQTSYSLPSHSINWSNIYFDQSWSSNQSANLDYGSYGYLTIIHEFLHALGLDHPADYNGFGDYLVDADFEQDTHRYTVMSYFDAEEDNSGAVHFYESGGRYHFTYPQTPMVYDILALSQGSFDGNFGGYDLNTATRNGETTYGYNATGGINQVFNFATNGAPVVTIYDAGGIDTLDLSGDTETVAIEVTYNPDGSVDGYNIQTRTESVIDLREGQYSSTHGMKDNIGIAFGTEIENAIGTQFNDTIYGNDLGNVLDGGGGSDSFYGGDGWDTVTYQSSTSRIILDLQVDRLNFGDAVGDTFSDIEAFHGTEFTDNIRGDSQDNTLFGGLASDRLHGRAGDDVLFGEIGYDKLYGNAGADIMSGGADFALDRFIYFAFNDSRTGAGNRDQIIDFMPDHDRIEISRLDADITTADVNDIFRFIFDSEFSGSAGELRYQQNVTDNNTIIQADADGDAVSDFEIELAGLLTLDFDNFVL